MAPVREKMPAANCLIGHRRTIVCNDCSGWGLEKSPSRLLTLTEPPNWTTSDLNSWRRQRKISAVANCHVFQANSIPLVLVVFSKRILLTQILPCVALVVSAVLAIPSDAIAQSSTTTWKTWDQTFTRDEPVTEYCWEEKEVIETSYRKKICLLYTSPSPRDATLSRMPSSA